MTVDVVADCCVEAVNLLPGDLGSGFSGLGKSPTADRGDGEWVMRCGDSKCEFVGLGLGNNRDKSIRGGRSLRLESLDEFLEELRETEEGSGLSCLSVGEALESIVESRELK